MLGWVTLQFIKAKRVLKPLVSLEPKFQEKPWAPKYHHSYLWAVPLPFCAHTEGASWHRVPVGCPGAPWHTMALPRADLSAENDC